MNALHTYWWVFIPCAALVGYVLRGRREFWYANRGEALVRQVLMSQLPSDSWHLLNNVTLQVDGGTTQIDHVLVSRYGVFVIETKHYKGWIFGDEKSKQWTQVIYSQKHRFQNPLHQNYKHLKAVQALLDFLAPEQVVGMVVFTGDAEFKSSPPTGVYSLVTLVAHLKKLDQQQLSENRMQFCVGRLECKRLSLQSNQATLNYFSESSGTWAAYTPNVTIRRLTANGWAVPQFTSTFTYSAIDSQAAESICPMQSCIKGHGAVTCRYSEHAFVRASGIFRCLPSSAWK